MLRELKLRLTAQGCLCINDKTLNFSSVEIRCLKKCMGRLFTGVAWVAPLLFLKHFEDVILLTSGLHCFWCIVSCDYIRSSVQDVLGFPGGSAVKNPPANTGDMGSIPRPGRSPGGGNGNLLYYSCLDNPRDRGAWQATVHGVTKSHMWFSDWLNNNNNKQQYVLCLLFSGYFTDFSPYPYSSVILLWCA